MLRQPKTVSIKEKHDYVEDVIDMLNMRDFADAIVGVPGQGLNVEQRKLLTIGVELAAKPKLLLFLDEPTSGLDSQSSWAICAFLRKLADAGQAILCTIHQVRLHRDIHVDDMTDSILAIRNSIPTVRPTSVPCKRWQDCLFRPNRRELENSSGLLRNAWRPQMW